MGLRDAGGRRARECALRVATASDEMRALQDFRVHLRPESFLTLMLARTVTRLGHSTRVDVRLLESLCAADLQALEDVYRELNGYPARDAGTDKDGRTLTGTATE